ncbi:hypothetical protein EDD86DRAFT_278503 [Gorgonomyces haynaldii]|nr:hypothetical protein EDD86DRAFT_278503 [Gorgonomyces haynaldii]
MLSEEFDTFKVRSITQPDFQPALDDIFQQDQIAEQDKFQHLFQETQLFQDQQDTWTKEQFEKLLEHIPKTEEYPLDIDFLDDFESSVYDSVQESQKSHKSADPVEESQQEEIEMSQSVEESQEIQSVEESQQEEIQMSLNASELQLDESYESQQSAQFSPEQTPTDTQQERQTDTQQEIQQELRRSKLKIPQVDCIVLNNQQLQHIDIDQGLELHCAVNRLHTLTSLVHLKDLQILDLSFNQLEDLSGLSSLDLRKLNLSGNQISDIRPLYQLDRLVELVLDFNKITFLDFQYCQLLSLERLSLRHNQIKHMAHLNMMRLMELNLSHNYLKRFVLLKPVNVLDLDLSHNCLERVDGQFLPFLERLSLTGNQLTGFESLERLEHVKILELGSQPNWQRQVLSLNPIKLDLSRMSLIHLHLNPNTIRHLDLSQTELVSLEFAVHCPQLETLLADKNDIQETWPLVSLKLERLSLRENKIHDIAIVCKSLSKVPLKYLDLSGNPFNSFSVLDPDAYMVKKMVVDYTHGS